MSSATFVFSVHFDLVVYASIWKIVFIYLQIKCAETNLTFSMQNAFKFAEEFLKCTCESIEQ